jgi:hypothetical protein
LYAITVTLGLAAATVILQLWLKLISRQPPPGRRHALTLDDAVWWIDWIVTASITLVVYVLLAIANHKEVTLGQVGLAMLSLFLGYSAMPYVVRLFCYDPTGNFKDWRLIIPLNVFGIVILLASVAAGVELNVP